MKHAVYMDYNATAPLRPAVGDAMAEALEITGNPSSVHRFGRLARRVIEEARRQVASLVGAEANEVIFTSGGTEANNLALGSFDGAGIVVSAAEHDSVLGAAPGATMKGGGPRSYQCGTCGKTLVKGVGAMQIVNIVFKCNKCDGFNEIPTAHQGH